MVDREETNTQQRLQCPEETRLVVVPVCTDCDELDEGGRYTRAAALRQCISEVDRQWSRAIEHELRLLR